MFPKCRAGQVPATRSEVSPSRASSTLAVTLAIGTAGRRMPAVAFEKIVDATPRDPENAGRACLVATDGRQCPENQFGIDLFQRGAEPNHETQVGPRPSSIGQINWQITGGKHR
jgi:hypothetical protein